MKRTLRLKCLARAYRHRQRDAEVKNSVELTSQDFTPKNRIADSVIDEEAVAEPQSIMEVSTAIEEPTTIQRRG